MRLTEEEYQSYLKSRGIKGMQKINKKPKKASTTIKKQR